MNSTLIAITRSPVLSAPDPGSASPGSKHLPVVGTLKRKFHLHALGVDQGATVPLPPLDDGNHGVLASTGRACLEGVALALYADHLHFAALKDDVIMQAFS